MPCRGLASGAHILTHVTGDRVRHPGPKRSVRSVVTFCALAAGLWGWSMFLPATAAAQADGANPRTSWGDPDLQGVWVSSAVIGVPFERSEEFGTRAVLTDEELAARNAAAAARVRPRLVPPAGWGERRPAPPLASLIVDPPNGRLPPMTGDGARRADEWRTKAGGAYAHAGPEDLRPYDRCISRGVLGSQFPNIYASAFWILQTPGQVVIHHEMVHETRVIPLDGSPHIAAGIRQWMGDSRGRWEGETLVVETTNHNGRTGSYARNGNGNPTSEALRLVERFRLGDSGALDYEVRIEDPKTWTRPWTVRFPLAGDPDYVLFEYACHEANYAVPNILSGVRAAERAATR